MASFGSSPTAALKALGEAVSLYLSNARKLGMLEDLEPTLTAEVRFSTSLHVTA